MANILPTLTAYTNLILLLANSNQDLRKFIVWNIEGSKPAEVLSNLEITRISIENQKKIFEHPIETGVTVAEHEILEPKSVNIEAYIAIDDTETLTEFEQLYLNGAKLRLRAENRIINNMVIAAQPAEITGSVFDKTKYSIRFKQALEVMPQYIAMQKAKNPADTSRVNTGVSQGKEVKESWLLSVFTGGRT